MSITESLESTLRDRIGDAAAFNPQGWASDVVTGCQGAAEALAAVQDTLRDAMNPPGLNGLRELLSEQRAKEVDTNEAES